MGSIYVLILLTKIDLQHFSEAGYAGIIRLTYRWKKVETQRD